MIGPHHRQLLRFVLVGVLNTGFSYLVYVGLLYAGVHYVLANLGALVLGIVFSFRTQGLLVFGNPEWRRLRRFVPVWGFMFLINTGLIALLLRFGFNAYVAGALALLPVVALSYLLQKFFVFMPSDPPAAAAKVSNRRS
jgi:putative flippase GtrA